MKFSTTPRFDRDWKALPREHRQLFKLAMPDFSAACDEFIRSRGAMTWPANLRVRPMAGARGIWELTWSFAQPDGRATFEFITDAGDVRVRWRRIGRHDIFTRP